jgi:hypothetical protein
MWEGKPGNCRSGLRIRNTRMNQERVVPDTPTSSRSGQAGPIVDVEFGAKHSLIEVELTNVRENPHEPGNFLLMYFDF